MWIAVSRLHATGRRWSQQYGPAIVSLSFLLLTLGLIYWRVIRGYTPPVSFAQWPEPPNWVQSLYTLRWFVRGLQVVAGLMLIYIEWASRALSSWLNSVLGDRLTGFTFISIIGFLLGSYLIQPGHLASGDASPHIAGGWAVLESIKDGQWFVYWSNYGYFGHPFLQFYSVIYYYLVALTSLVARDFYQANDFVLVLLHTLSAYPMYLYVQQVTKSRVGGLVAAIAWSGTFYRYHLIVVLGKLTTAPFIALWPLQFYFAEKLYQDESPRYRWWGGPALTVGAMLWTHKLYGLWAIVMGLVYTGTQIIIRRSQGSNTRILVRLAMSISAYVMGAFIGFYEIIPSYIEQSLTLLGARNADHFNLPAIFLQNVLVFEGSYLTDWFGGYIGNTIVACAMLVVILAVVVRYVPV